MKILLILSLLLCVGCEDVVELALQPNIHFLSQHKIPGFSYDSALKDTLIAANDWETFKSRPDILIISANNLSTAYNAPYNVIFRRRNGNSTPNGYFYHIKNIGNDTAYNVNVRINSTEGEKILFSAHEYLRNRSSSDTIWLEPGQDFIGSATIDFETRR